MAGCESAVTPVGGDIEAPVQRDAYAHGMFMITHYLSMSEGSAIRFELMLLAGYYTATGCYCH